MEKVNNDNVTIKNARFFLDGYKDVYVSVGQKASGGIFAARAIQNLIGEPLNNIISMDLEKISPRKWQVTHIMTEENSFNTEDDDLYISSQTYDLKRITNQVEIYQYNFFFGIQKEAICKKELEEYPDSFKVLDENDNEVTQEQLATMTA